MIPVFIMVRTVITKWDDCSTFDIPTVVLKDIQHLFECQMYCNHLVIKTGMIAAVGLSCKIEIKLDLESKDLR